MRSGNAPHTAKFISQPESFEAQLESKILPSRGALPQRLGYLDRFKHRVAPCMVDQFALNDLETDVVSDSDSQACSK